MKGLLTKGIGGFYYVETENGCYECKARGVFRKNGITPTVGDKVEISVVSEEHKKGSLDTILPRKNLLIRPSIANVDHFIIVAPAKSPDFDSFFVDKLLVFCELYEIAPLIVINKTDLEKGQKYGDLYSRIGYPVIYTSTLTGEGIFKVKESIFGGINVFAGFSGAGKSSLLNELIENAELKTGEISKITRGRHTTRHSELFLIAPNTYVADTPGFSSLEIDFAISNLDELFPEFRDISCQFKGCSHTKEKGCGVLECLLAGEIAPSRYQSYLQIHEKIKDIKPWHKK